MVQSELGLLVHSAPGGFQIRLPLMRPHGIDVHATQNVHILREILD